MTAAEALAQFGTDLRHGMIPEKVTRAAKESILDTLGCGLAAVALDEGTAALAVVKQEGAEGAANAIGIPTGLPATSAALANGMLCHALDFDDTHEGARAHVGSVVVPAALAAAQANKRSGAEMITAVVAGAEVAIRVGLATGGAMHARGFHPTSVNGIFGATIAAAHLYGLDAGQTTAAMGLAGSMASGLMEYLGDGSPTKPLHAGWAAHGALYCAQLSRAGGRGPASVLEGRFGVLASYAGGVGRLDEELSDLGDRWEVPNILPKLYPACHYVHSCVDAARRVTPNRTLNPQEIMRVTARIPRAGAALVVEPVEVKRRPRTTYEAKFSLPYVVAAQLVRGDVTIQTFTKSAIADQAVLSVSERIGLEFWEAGDEPSALAGEVLVELANGDRRHALVTNTPGAGDNPLPADAMGQKYRANAGLALDSELVDDLAREVMALDYVPTVERVGAILSYARSFRPAS